MPLTNKFLRIRHLRCILPFLRAQPQLWIRRFRWNILGYMCWNSMVRSGCHHDELSTREIQRKIHLVVLDDLQSRCSYWFFSKAIELGI